MVGMTDETKRRLRAIVGGPGKAVPANKKTDQIVKGLTENFQARDGDALKAIRDRYYPGREWIMRAWLLEYSVIRNSWKSKLTVSPVLRSPSIVKVALRYVDKHVVFGSLKPRASIEIDREGLIDLFTGLEASCSAITGTEQVSLASKVLWLCFPNSAPMYDRFVVSALAPSQRGLKYEQPPVTKYAATVRDWFEAYTPYRPQIEAFCLARRNVFPVRFFDWALMAASPEAQRQQPAAGSV